MTYIRPLTSAVFTAGEDAPSPAKALESQPIVNQLGTLALSGFEEDGQTVILDRTVEPPVLRLVGATVCVTLVNRESDGTFSSAGSYAPNAMVDGDYIGPGSRLDLY